uniref:Fe2OG dioxygenase domain-containing protein n=1 Tax=Kalanchoe fedtschenkoi TaxID=63787 RepID=A0A7N0T0J6_KALFE
MAANEDGSPLVPERYVLPPSQRPNPRHFGPDASPATLPVIDLAQCSDQSQLLHQVRKACNDIGFFQVVNHGIPEAVVEGALNCATDFFNLPAEEKMQIMSDDVREPVRYGTSLNHVIDKIHFWRDFIKHYSHPISDWIDLWPSNPPSYKEKMGAYATAVQALQVRIMHIILESLGLDPNRLDSELEHGSQVMAVNCYPACPQPELALGMPPHSDYGSLTILLQSNPGLQIIDQENNWVSVPLNNGALIVHLGDQMEVMSNGAYKSVVHRAIVSSATRRLSIASLHSLGLQRRIGPMQDLVDEDHPASYGEFSFGDFLEFLSRNDITKGRFIDTLRTNNKAKEHQ